MALSLVGITAAVASWMGYKSIAPGRSAAAGIGEFPVHVAGAVARPGVIYANADMIVEEALRQAGGETENADLSQVNLAARMEPNSQLYVPSKGEVYDPSRLGVYAAHAAPTHIKDSDSEPQAGALIDINHATLQQLDSLPGVGPVTAQRIIDYRNNVGPFKRVEDLLGVKGIGPKKLEKIRPLVMIR